MGIVPRSTTQLQLNPPLSEGVHLLNPQRVECEAASAYSENEAGDVRSAAAPGDGQDGQKPNPWSA